MKSLSLKFCRMLKIYKDINPPKYEPCSPPQPWKINFLVFLVLGGFGTLHGRGTQAHRQEGPCQELWGVQTSYFAQWFSKRCSWSVQTLIGPTFIVSKRLSFSFGAHLGTFAKKKKNSNSLGCWEVPIWQDHTSHLCVHFLCLHEFLFAVHEVLEPYLGLLVFENWQIFIILPVFSRKKGM
jgi:hypothetical protein